LLKSAAERPLALSLILACAALAACAHEDNAASDPAPIPMLVEQGALEFQQYCSSCHGLSARGDGPAAAALVTPPADLTRIAARRGGTFPDAEIAQTIDGRFALPAHGSREMPIWGTQLGDPLAPSEFREEVVRGRILNLIEYLKSIQQPAG
jgi:mono/diheme cytochrome c family protein